MGTKASDAGECLVSGNRYILVYINISPSAYWYARWYEHSPRRLLQAPIHWAKAATSPGNRPSYAIFAHLVY